MINLLITVLTLWLSVSAFAPTTINQKYIAKLTSNGEQSPAVVVICNTFSGTPTWERIGVGRYRVTLAGAFMDENKTTGIREFHFLERPTGPASGFYSYRLYWDDEVDNPGDSLILQTFDTNMQAYDEVLSVTEIRFGYYP